MMTWVEREVSLMHRKRFVASQTEFEDFLVTDLYMICTWYLHDIYMLFTWYLHDINISFTWYLHDMYISFTWYLHDYLHDAKQFLLFLVIFCHRNCQHFWTVSCPQLLLWSAFVDTDWHRLTQSKLLVLSLGDGEMCSLLPIIFVYGHYQNINGCRHQINPIAQVSWLILRRFVCPNAHGPSAYWLSSLRLKLKSSFWMLWMLFLLFRFLATWWGTATVFSRESCRTDFHLAMCTLVFSCRGHQKMTMNLSSVSQLLEDMENWDKDLHWVPRDATR